MREQQVIIDNLVTWIYYHTKSEFEYTRALRACGISKEDIKGYTEDYKVPTEENIEEYNTNLSVFLDTEE
jgi:hypothetical protein